MSNSLSIKEYCETRDYEHILQDTMEEEWQSFYCERKEEYRLALLASDTFVAFYQGVYAGYVRAISDKTFTIFVPEIIVTKAYRNHGIGRALLAHLNTVYPSARIDLLSDQDEFYHKIGFRSLGCGMRRSDWY